MRVVISDQNIRERKRKKVVVQALSSLTFETNSERGIMPAVWTDITLDYGPKGILISFAGAALHFQFLIWKGELDKYLRKGGT